MRLKLLQILAGTHPEDLANTTDHFAAASCIHTQYQKLIAAAQYFVQTVGMLSSANQEAVLAFFKLDINRQQIVVPVIDQSRNVSPLLQLEYLQMAENIVSKVMLPSRLNDPPTNGPAISPSDSVESVLWEMALNNLVIESNYSKFMLLQYALDGVFSAITSVCRVYVKLVAYLLITLENDLVARIIDLLNLSPAVMSSIMPIVSYFLSLTTITTASRRTKKSNH